VGADLGLEAEDPGLAVQHEEDPVQPERGEVEDGEVGFKDRGARVLPG